MDQETQISSNWSMKKVFSEAPFYLLLLLSFILPLLTRFGGAIGSEYLKTAVLFVLVTLALIIFALTLVTKKTIHFLKHPIVYGALAVLVGGLLSAVFSAQPGKSFFGNGFELGTFFGVFSFFLVFFFAAIYARLAQKVFSFVLLLAISSSVAFLLLVLSRFVWVSWLGFELISQTVVGAWTESALFFGSVSLLLGIVWELMPLSGWMKKIIIIGFVLSLAGFIVTDFALAWWIIGIMTLIYTVYRVSLLKPQMDGSLQAYYKSHWLTPTVFIVLLSLIFVLFGGDGSLLDRGLGKILPPTIDARPTWPVTLSVAKETWRTNPYLGSGMNRFSPELLKNKPDAINMSPFWGVDFNYGVGYVPTVLVTQGIVGSILWFIFLAAILFYVAKNLFRGRGQTKSDPLFIVTAFTMATCWVILFSFVPGPVLLFLAFLFTGLFVGLLVGESETQVISLGTDTKNAFGFAALALLVIVILGGVTLEYVYAQKGRALAYHGQAIELMRNDGDFVAAVTLLDRANRVSLYDAYLRTLVDARIADLTLRLNQGKLAPTEIQTMFMNEFPGILSSAELAIAADPSDYLNWVSLATTYQMALSLGVTNAYDRALAAYEEALILNPKGPGLYLGLARLELARNNFSEAKVRLDQALTLKPDYVDALYLHSQIAVRTGKTEDAIKRAITATAISPDNVGLLFQLGILYYTNGNYEEAATVLERAVSLQGDFSNARYYLGLVNYKLGKKDLALSQFEQVLSLNPQSELAQEVVVNVRAGRDPLFGIELTGESTLSLPAE